MTEEDYKRQVAWLEDLELRLNHVRTMSVSSVQDDRILLMVILKDELDVIHRQIWAHNFFWENLNKLKSLEEAHAAFEEQLAAERVKRSLDR